MTRVAGVILGIALAMAIVDSIGGRAAGPHLAPGPMISECDGALAEIVIQYVSVSEPVVPVYRDFLRQLSSDVIVHIACPDRDSYDELVDRLGDVSCRLNPVVTNHEMTAWSRDRWVALGGARVELLAPKGELGAENWPARKGDEQLVFDLANASHDRSITARRSELYFDAGDFLADGSRVFVTPAVLRRNLQRTVQSRAELMQVLKRTLGCEIVLLDGAPDHHAGMFMMAAGDNVMLVGDPSLARKLIAPDSFLPELPGGPDWSSETQRKFDSVANQLTSVGYRVVRIPTVVGHDAKSYITYVNVITDHRDGRHIVYLPQFQAADSLNDHAAQVWRSLGYEVHPVDCTSTYRLFGNLHCLVNVLRRH